MFKILLAIHILAAVIFLGNRTTEAFWKIRANRPGNVETVALMETSRAQP